MGEPFPGDPVQRRLLALAGTGLALGVTNILAAPRLGRVPAAAWNLGTTALLLGLARRLPEEVDRLGARTSLDAVRLALEAGFPGD